MKQLVLLCLSIFAFVNLYGSNYLRIGDPRKSWSTEQGTIDEASLFVRPAGLFMEYELFLTFSSKGSSLTSNQDTLEVVLHFNLPEDAIVHDSWLWIEGEPVKAKHLDRWTASSIYENIVKRRRDPSILSKLSATQYELRIFPMAGNETRKVKITWLMPASLSHDLISSILPTEILNTSAIIPANFNVLAWESANMTNPQIVNDTELNFTAYSKLHMGDYFETVIPSVKYTDLRIGFSSSVSNGCYFSRSSQGTDGIYQLAIFPKVLFDSATVRKAAILVDFDELNTTLKTNELLNLLKIEMLANLNRTDSFNLIFSNLKIMRYSEKWIAASSENIETAFKSYADSLSKFSNLVSLIGNGIDFIKNNGNDGKIILVANSDQYTSYQGSNTIVTELLASMNPKIQIHISEFQSTHIFYFYINGKPYIGNEYLFSNLSKLTLGSYQRVFNDFSVSEVIRESFRNISESLHSFDLHTSVESGFCYSRYTMTGNNNMAYSNRPILQVGKYKGNFPFVVEISGEYKNQLFSQKIIIPEENTLNIDTIAEEIWTGQYIKSLESGQQRNEIVSEIVSASLKERVLSQYTSFLCLEKNAQICLTCWNDNNFNNNGPVITTTEIAEVDSIRAYPNPFVENITIELNCSNPEDIQELAICNITGSVIRQFDADNIHSGNNRLTWNGTDNRNVKVKAGVYLLVYQTTSGRKIIKLLKK